MIRRAADGTGAPLVKDRVVDRCLRAAEALGDRASKREQIMLDAWAARRRGESAAVKAIATRTGISQAEAGRQVAALKEERLFPPRVPPRPDVVADQPMRAGDVPPGAIAAMTAVIRAKHLEDKRKAGGGTPGPSPRLVKSQAGGMIARWKGRSLAAEVSS
jgi:hypothetical protein